MMLGCVGTNRNRMETVHGKVEQVQRIGEDDRRLRNLMMFDDVR